MSSIQIKSYEFSKRGIETLGADSQETNWPVVYQIYNRTELYVGETTNLKSRMSQHRQNSERIDLQKFSVVFDHTFNKSAALDLESQLIQWFSGEGKYRIQNKNDGLLDRDYYGRSEYRSRFPHIWEELRKLNIADMSIQDIENSGLFKFSPYKRLNESQSEVVYETLMDLEEAFIRGQKTISVIGGNEGTGKTIVIMYLIKLIRDIQDFSGSISEDDDGDNQFNLFFKEPFNSRFRNKSLALVIPNQSLKGSVSKIFRSISNLGATVDVLSPIEFGSNDKTYDITFVDEAHLLKASNQEVHKANRERVNAINESLFNDKQPHTELDWVIKKSNNVVMVYGDQRIRPNNVTHEDVQKYRVREHILKSQMRSIGGELYIEYLRDILSDAPPAKKQAFTDFEFKLYDSFEKFLLAIRSKEAEVGLSRVVAGYAWDWKSNKKSTRDQDDIVIDGHGLKWNSTLYDWIGSKKSVDEVGSIYTIQGYDLNYCGVIIGNDLRFDPARQRLVLDRKNYFDRGAKKRTKQQIEAGLALTDDELLDQVIRTYRILMNRSIRGTYVYVCDKNLRAYLSQFIDTVL